MHWALVVAVAAAWTTGEVVVDRHEFFGWSVAAIVACRLVWGVVGPAHARFGGFVRSGGDVARYARDVFRRRESRYLGHNPLGGWSVVVLLSVLAAACFTGWLYTTDRFWGMAWLDRLHGALAWLVLALIALHIAGVAYASVRHRENLVRAMVDGDKRPPRGTDVP